jgi:hypothetical protein
MKRGPGRAKPERKEKTNENKSLKKQEIFANQDQTTARSRRKKLRAEKRA